MKRAIPAFILILILYAFQKEPPLTEWIRINQLGYTPAGIKVAVWCSKEEKQLQDFELINAVTHKPVYKNKAGQPFGKYGPFLQTYRLSFSAFKSPGKFYLRAGNAQSPVFEIGNEVYKGAADFCLRYMRQQRNGFNPFLKDSCHTHDGYTLYAPVPDSTHIDVVGGWHDASDYLQYSTTSANAAYHLLAAYRDFSQVFNDEKQANGLDGSNGIADVLDEAKWGLDWMLKMNPKDDWMFNQLGDDRDHRGMRIPKEDTNFYGKGLERPVYFCNGEPQVRGKFKNNTTGVASTAGKFSSAFGLGYKMFLNINKPYAETLLHHSAAADKLGLSKPGACQTASVRSPYIYAEDNWTDDMELAAAIQYDLQKDRVKKTGIPAGNSATDFLNASYSYALQEPVTPWMGKDSANHYQWYPFINVGHYELAKRLQDKRRDTIIRFYKEGIEQVWQKAQQNAFYRNIPFIWCSNNLTVSFAIQCYWYRQLTGDDSFGELEQANFDWIFGCNPWGTSMVYGLPSWGDTPVDPHSAFTHLKNYPIDGGLVDGPVYTNIYKNLIGIQLMNTDQYEAFQSDLAVYHDDYGDYSTNEPTMDGTASLIYLLAAKEAEEKKVAGNSFNYSHGAIIRGDSSHKEIALIFTADEYGDGLPSIIKNLKEQQIKASFFFTGNFYRNKKFQPYIQQLYRQGNYLGPHSDKHLLYCDWDKRDSLLVNREIFSQDLDRNYLAMQQAGITRQETKYFIPPYEWYNDTIAAWADSKGVRLFNFTPGTKSNADYTWPQMGNYKSTEEIFQSVIKYEKEKNLNGFILLLHAGTDPRRTDKFYSRLEELLDYLKKKGYNFKRIDELLSQEF